MNEQTSTSFVLWSGGIDSTYLIWKRLKAGCKVIAATIELRNNRVKTVAEARAVEKLSELFRNEFDGFHYVNLGAIELLNSKATFQSLLWSVIASQFYGFDGGYRVGTGRVDEVCIGLISGDGGVSYVDELREVWASIAKLDSCVLPPLTFPIIKSTKHSIKTELPSKYADLCWFCENPIERKMPDTLELLEKSSDLVSARPSKIIDHNNDYDIVACGECDKCKQEIARQLRLI